MTFEQYAEIEGVVAPKELPDGRVAFLHRLMFTVSLCVGRLEDGDGYEDRWCYHDEKAAREALMWWDGEGEPDGWHRHPFSGRRRPGGDAAQEYVAK